MTASVLDVDRELVPGAQLRVDVGQAGDPELGELLGGRLGHLAPAQERPDGPVVDEHDLAVAREPRVALETPRSGLSARRNAGIVFSGSSSRAPR